MLSAKDVYYFTNFHVYVGLFTSNKEKKNQKPVADQKKKKKKVRSTMQFFYSVFFEKGIREIERGRFRAFTLKY